MPKEHEPEDVELAAYKELKRLANAVERIARVLDVASDTHEGAFKWTVVEGGR